MHDDHQDCWCRLGFDIEVLTRLGRAGSLPSGYLDSYGDLQRARHAKLDREIKAVFAEAANDPELRERLGRPLT